MTQQIQRNAGMDILFYCILFCFTPFHAVPFNPIPFHFILFYSMGILFDYLRFYSILFDSQTH